MLRKIALPCRETPLRWHGEGYWNIDILGWFCLIRTQSLAVGVRQTLQITSCTPWFLLGVRQTAMDIILGKLIFLTIRGKA